MPLTVSDGLKIHRGQPHACSSPALGIENSRVFQP
jgi:hypothetical protein